MSKPTIQHGRNFVADCTDCNWKKLEETVQDAYIAAEVHVSNKVLNHRVLVYEATVIFKG